MDYSKALSGENIAESLDEDKLTEIGNSVVEGFLLDKKTRKDWEEEYKTNLEMALQVSSNKTYPWNGASNVKFPLLSTAAMQFNARAYPALIPSDGTLVKCKTYGADVDGAKFLRSQRIGKHMTYQFREDMEYWEEEMDKLLLILPIIGIAFKKSYWDSEKEKIQSHLILPENLVVSYYTRCLEDAERVTEIIYKSKRKFRECQLSGYYLDKELAAPSTDSVISSLPLVYGTEPSTSDETTPYVFLEQHCYLDLDDDGYPEPYVVTVDLSSRTVLRIGARFEEDGFKVENDKVVRIDPVNYYTKYGFIPNPDGSFYDIGFGKLLGPLGHSIDTLINQLIDSGSLSILQAGFIGKGLKLRMGETKFSPGEWKAVNGTGDDLRKQIVPLPTKDPSPVLFQLLGMLVQSVKELASVAEIMVGKMPGQNTPAYTTQETVKQGMALFTAIYKRVYRSLSNEFRKVYRLNKIYLDTQEEISVLDEPIQQSDYKAGDISDVIPTADPSAASQTEKVNKAQQLGSLLQLGTIDPMAVTMRILSAMEVEKPEELIRKEPPAPDPKMMAAQAKAKADQDKVQLEMEKSKMDFAMKQQEQQFNLVMEQQKQEMEMKFNALKQMLELQSSNAKIQQQLSSEEATHQMGMITKAQAHEQDMRHKEETLVMKSKESAKKPASKPKE